MRRSLNASVLNRKLVAALYEDEDRADAEGLTPYSIKIAWTDPDDPGSEKSQEVSVRADNPESAKSKAMNAATDMGRGDARVVSVNAIPDAIKNKIVPGDNTINDNPDETNQSVSDKEVAASL